MSNSPNLYIARTPFQVLSALEAKESFKDPGGILALRFSPESRNNLQTVEVAKLGKWDRIYYLGRPRLPQLRLVSEVSFLRQLSNERLAFDTVFTADFSSIFVSNAKKRRTFLLDDGSGTLAVQSYYQSPANAPWMAPEENPQRDRFFRFLGIKTAWPQQLDLFTCFKISPLPDQQVITHNFEFTRKFLENQAHSQSQAAYILGSNFVEDNSLSLECYVNLVANVARTLKHKPVIYLPHRRESPKTLEKIRSLGIDIQFNQYPVELEFAMRRVRPAHITSFASTALYTLSKLYPDATVESFRIPENLINPANVGFIRAAYEALQGSVQIRNDAY